MRRAIVLVCVLFAACGSAGQREASVGAPACTTLPGAVVLVPGQERWPHFWAHVQRAEAKGKPRHLHIDRGDAVLHRHESLAGIPVKAGSDRDEYPPAFSAEGGKGADVEYVPSSENRSQGTAMGRALAPYCDGQMFELTP